jgi:LacI family transcriptional regulator
VRPSRLPYAVTIHDVARKAGVSISTVSRVINRNVPVSDKVRERVLTTMRELSYQPRTAARNLATRKTNALGLLLTDIQGDFFAPLLSGIEAVTAEAGFDLLISTSRRASRDEIPQSVGVHNTDGLLVFAGSLSEAGLRYCCSLGFPIVLIHQSPPASLDIPCVTVENKAASRRLVEHLILTHGRRRIAFLRGPEAHEDSYWREMGYRQALEEHGLLPGRELIAQGGFDRWVARASVRDLLAAEIQIDAIYAGDDEAAVGVLEALHEVGIHVPEGVSVVGFDDQRMSAYLTPALTTIRAPTEEVGRQAARQLVSLVRTGVAARLSLLPTEIVIRRSCGCGG